MSTLFSQLPGELNLSLTVGDEFGMLVDLDFDATNFTWSAIVYETTISNTATTLGVNTQGATVATFAVTDVVAANGQINVSLTETQTAALVPTTLYRWYLRGVSPALVTRTYLSGTLTPYAP